MYNKFAAYFFVVLSLFTSNFKDSNPIERVVLKSVPSNRWYENVYLMADKINWMDYRNFTVQIGDNGEKIYHFPHWYHGKYDAGLYREDVSGDGLEDVIVVLNNDAAGPEKPIKDIHVLNQVHDPYSRYEEAPVESIQSIVDRRIKIDEHGDVVTVAIDTKKYTIDLTKYQPINPHNPYVNIERMEYSVKNEKLLGTVPACIEWDDWVSGELIGYFHIEYYWDGKWYKAKSIGFEQHTPGH